MNNDIVMNPVFTTKPTEGSFCVKKLTDVVSHKLSAVYYMSAHYSNPQGTPGVSGNPPRTDPFDSHGILLHNGFNRHSRNTMALRHNANLFLPMDGVAEQQARAVAEKVGIDLDTVEVEAPDGEDSTEGEVEEAPKGKPGKKDKRKLTEEEKEQITRVCCQIYPDMAALGGLICTINRRVRGAIHVTPLRSVHPVEERLFKLTTRTVASFKEKEDKDGTFGSLTVVPFALYAGVITVDAEPCRMNGVTYELLNQYFDSIEWMWSLSKSFMRPDIRFQRMDIVLHGNKFGSFQDQRLHTMARAALRGDVATQTEPRPSSMDDYELSFDKSLLPDNCQHIIRLG